VADTKDFLVKLEPVLGNKFQTFCKAEGRSQQSVFSLMVHNFLTGANDPSGDPLVEGLTAELIFQGLDYQQGILDDLQEKRMVDALSQLQQRKAMRK